MTRAILVDDEKSSLETLRQLLENYCPEIEILATSQSAEEAITLIQQHKPELLFLDVELPLGSGFDLLENDLGVSCDVIFTTAHDEYALRAIKFCALDYLLKPVSVGDLKSAVAKIKQTGQTRTPARVDTFFENLAQLDKQLSKIVLPALDGFVVTKVAEIVRCQADKNYTNFVLTSGENILVSKTLKEYDDLLTEFDFIRIHQSHLINAAHVQRYIKGSGGYVKMSDDSIIEVSRRKKTELMSRFLPQV